MTQTYINEITEPGEVLLQKETSGSLIAVNDNILWQFTEAAAQGFSP
jgi:hypothetical protein